MTNTTTSMARVRTLHYANPFLRLLWKEFGERRWWAIAWALLILVGSLFAHGQQFCGDRGMALPPWNYLPLIYAGIVGLGGYTAELKRGRALFLFTRAVRWQEVLGAKILFSAIILFGVPLLAACIFRFTCPEPYRHFVTLPHVLAGVWTLAWPAALCYLSGLACSVILPGLAGSALTVISIATAVLLALGCNELLGWLYGSDKLINVWSPDMRMHVVRAGILIFTVVGVWWGGVSAMQRGLSLHYSYRLKRFAPRMLLTILIGVVAALCLPGTLLSRLIWHWYPENAGAISPGGSYAIRSFERYDILDPIDVDRHSWEAFDARKDFIRLADQTLMRRGQLGKIDDVYYHYYWTWVTDTVAVGRNYEKHLLYHADTNSMVPIVVSDEIGKPSPDGSRTVTVERIDANKRKPGGKLYLKFYDLMNGRSKDMVIPIANQQTGCLVWWESNDTVAYYLSWRENDKQETGPGTRHEEVHRVRVPQF